MTDWKTLKEVAEELRISKDLVKYHRRHLSEQQLIKQEGRYYVSEDGIEEIRSRLKQEKYSAGFEETVLNRLSEIEREQKLVRELLFRLLNGEK